MPNESYDSYPMQRFTSLTEGENKGDASEKHRFIYTALLSQEG